eukprot:SAG22_NODE_3498_length_1680_cov_1.380139_2_plen_67_part_00
MIVGSMRSALHRMHRVARTASNAPTRNQRDQMIAGPWMALVASPAAETESDSIECPAVTPSRSGSC